MPRIALQQSMPDAIVAHTASLASFANAESLVSDAKALVRRGSYGHAMAFLILAEEEIGKAFLWELEAFGVQVPRIVIRSHEAKQFAKVVIFDLLDLLLFDLLEGLMRVSAEPDVTARNKKVKKFMARTERKWKETDPGEMDAKFRSELERLVEMERLKESGLYVDILEDGTVSTPGSVSPVQAKRYLLLVERRFRRFRRIFELAPFATAAQLAKAREQWDPNRAGTEEGLRRIMGLLTQITHQGIEGVDFNID